MLDSVLLQRREVHKTLAAPHTLKLRLPGVNTLMFGQMLALLEALVTARTFERLLTCVDAAVALQLRRVPEALFAVGALQRLLPGRVAAVLHEFRG